MKKITLLKSLFVVLLLGVFSSSILAEEVISNTFSSTTMQKSVQTYTDTWENVSGTTLELFAFNNNQKGWAYVRCGRKADPSVATITTKAALAEKVTKVVVTIDNILDATKINATYLEVATDAAFTQNVQRTDVTIAKGDLTYTVATPTENCYYRLTVDCASHGSKNGIVQISKVDFYYEPATEPEPATGVTATWSIEEGDTIESFSAVTVTFAGVDSVGRKLDGVEVTKAYMMISTVATFFSVDADGNATPVVADLAEDYDGVLSGTNAGLSTTMKVREDRFTLVDGGYVKKGNYRIVIPTGTVLMQPNRSGLEKVYNDTEFVLNFVIDNDYEETTTPVEVDSYYTANPEDGSKVAEIRNVVITFDDATAITLAELGETPDPIAWPFCNKVLEVEDFGTQTSPIAPMACSVEGNALTLSIVANDYTDSLDYISVLGNYTITIPAGLIFFSDTTINKAITLNYTVAEILPDTVRFANIAAIYRKGIWEKERYADYSWYETIAILESQPTVVDVVVTSGMMGGNINNYYLNDGTGVVVLQAEGDMINPIMDEETWETIGWDTIPGLTLEVGKKLPAEFFSTINFNAVMDDETYLPTGEVYGAPILTYMPKVLGVEVDESGWEEQIIESNADFAARCETSDFIEAVVFANFDDVLANRIKYAGQLLRVDTAANYYAETMMDYMTGTEKTTAYFYWDAESAFTVETMEEEGTTYVFVYPNTTEDGYNYSGQLFNVIGENLPAAAFDAEATMKVAKVRFDWNSVAMGQSIILKEGWAINGPTVDVDNNSALNVNIYSNNGAVYVEAEAGSMIEVYTVNGLRIFAGISNTNTTVINGLNTNVAVIRVNGEACKVMVK